MLKTTNPCYVPETVYFEEQEFYKYHLYSYFPLGILDKGDEYTQLVTKYIWKFKDGEKDIQDEWISLVCEYFEDLLSNNPEYFGDLKDIVFFCIPASQIETNIKRLAYFSESICKNLKFNNGFDYTTIVQEGTPKHLKNVEHVEMIYKVNQNFFSGKKVIIFDDVFTQGNTAVKACSILKSANAQILFLITLGRTADRYHPDYNTIHPCCNRFAYRCRLEQQEQENKQSQENLTIE